MSWGSMHPRVRFLGGGWGCWIFVVPNMFPKFPNIFPIDPHLVYSKNLQGQFPVEKLMDALGVVMGMAFFRQV